MDNPIPLGAPQLVGLLEQYGWLGLFVISFGVNVWLLRLLLQSYKERVAENREQGRIIEANTNASSGLKSVIETALGLSRSNRMRK